MSEQNEGGQPGIPVEPSTGVQMPNEDVSRGAAAEPEYEAAPTRNPVSQPVIKATHAEDHNERNTTAKDPVAPKDHVVRSLTDKEIMEQQGLTLFIGSSKKEILAARQLISQWLNWDGVNEAFKNDDADATQLAAAQQRWFEYVETNFPGRTASEMAAQAKAVYMFSDEILDEIRLQSNMTHEEGINNLYDRGGYITGMVVGQKPGRNTEAHSLSESMRRDAAKTNDDKLQWDVMLPDSFVKVNFERPSRMTMGDLINDIRRTITGYVRQVNYNSAIIAQMAAAEAIWKFMVKYMKSSSVSDLTDFDELINLISWGDFEVLVSALLESFNTRGVNMNLRCMNMACNWSNFALVDPSSLVQVRWGIIPPSEAAMIANIHNGRLKLTAAQSSELRRKSTFGLESNRVYNTDRSQYFVIAPPTIGEAFSAFQFFITKVNPRLQDLRSTIVDQKEYEAQVGLVYAGLGSTEYIHWIQEYVRVAPPGSGEQDSVYRRWESEDPEFDKGIFDIITDHPDMNVAVTKFVLNKTPYLSRTFCGVQNFTCPKCREQHDGVMEGTEDVVDRRRGYTPINIVMSFFILTQLRMIRQVVEGHNALQEARSE